MTADVGATAILTARHQQLRQSLFEVPWKGYLPLEKEKFPHSNPLQATAFFTEKNSSSEIKNNKILSRAYLANSCSISTNMKESKQRLEEKSFSLGEVVLESNDLKDVKFCEQMKKHTAHKNVKIIEDHGNSLLLEKVQGPSILVLSDNNYPGWKVLDRLSHTELPIKIANLAFNAVLLDENKEYELEFKYKPQWFLKASLLTILGLLVMTLLSAVAIRQKFFLKR
jgi:hypothetical protein